MLTSLGEFHSSLIPSNSARDSRKGETRLLETSGTEQIGKCFYCFSLIWKIGDVGFFFLLISFFFPSKSLFWPETVHLIFCLSTETGNKRRTPEELYSSIFIL